METYSNVWELVVKWSWFGLTMSAVLYFVGYYTGYFVRALYDYIR